MVYKTRPTLLAFAALLFLTLPVTAQNQNDASASDTSPPSASQDDPNVESPEPAPLTSQEIFDSCYEGAAAKVGNQAADKICKAISRIAVETEAEPTISEKLTTAFSSLLPSVLTRKGTPQLTKAIEDILKAGLDINMAFKAHGNSVTLLMIAAALGDITALQKLIKAGATLTTVDAFGDTALVYAANSNQVDALKLLLESGADVNASGEHGRNACMYAARGGHVAALKELITAEIKIDAQDALGNTCIMEAAAGGCAECVARLIKAGAAVNTKNHSNMTALLFAVIKGDARCVSLLVKAGADVTVNDPQGTSALTIASFHGFADVVDVLVKAGVDGRADPGILHAARFGYYKIVRLLVKFPEAVDLQDYKGNTPLILAADDRIRDRSGEMQHIQDAAILDNKVKCVKALITAGADLSETNDEEENVFTILKQNQNKQFSKRCAAVIVNSLVGLSGKDEL